MKSIIILIGVLAIFSLSTNIYSKDFQIKIMSFNMQQPYGTNWDLRKDSAVKILKLEKADIIGTQEVVCFQREYLISKVEDYAWFGKGRDGEDNGEGCWIFYKKEKFEIDSSRSGDFWLSLTPQFPSRLNGKYNRLCTYAYFKIKNKDNGFYVINIHNYMPEEKELRKKAIQLFMQKVFIITKSEKMVITGDFNSPEEDEVTDWLKTAADNPVNLIDTYREFIPEGSVTTGFGTKLDYIYVPKNQKHKVINTYVVQDNKASDHMAIVAELEF